jgi:putative transposase
VGGIVRGEGGTLLEFGGTPDHVHLIAKFKADVSVAGMLRVIKAGSSKWINEKSDRTASRFAWQSGYAAFSVSESQVDAARAYVRNQKQHHEKQSFHDELAALLQKHAVEYDDRFLLD